MADRRPRPLVRAGLTACLAGLIAAASACAPPAPATQPAGLDLAGAARQVVADLSRQIAPSADTRLFVIDPMLDRASGQQTNASAHAESELRTALAEDLKGFSLLPFDRTGEAQAR
jgi:hypothetical protein